MTYYDRLNEFFLENEIEPLSPSAQLVYLHILHENNRLQNPNRFRCTNSRIAAMTGLSNQAITNAKRALTNRGLLEILADKDNPRAGTMYVLPEEAKLHVKSSEQQKGTSGASVSSEIKAAWKQNNDGTPPNETEMFYLAEDVKLHGEDAVKKAIALAGQKKRGGLSVYFFRLVLGDVVNGKEAKPNARRTTRNSVRYQFGADEAPEC